MRRFPHGVVAMCEGCGYYCYAGMPPTHAGGCPSETDPGAIRRHQFQQFGLALLRLLEQEKH